MSSHAVDLRHRGAGGRGGGSLGAHAHLRRRDENPACPNAPANEFDQRYQVLMRELRELGKIASGWSEQQYGEEKARLELELHGCSSRATKAARKREGQGTLLREPRAPPRHPIERAVGGRPFSSSACGGLRAQPREMPRARRTTRAHGQAAGPAGRRGRSAAPCGAVAPFTAPDDMAALKPGGHPTSSARRFARPGARRARPGSGPFDVEVRVHPPSSMR